MIDTLQHWKNLGRFLDWQGHQVFLVDSADHDPTADAKQVLLLVHGNPTSTWDFSHLWPQLSALSRGRRGSARP